MESSLTAVSPVQIAHALEALARSRHGDVVVARVEAMLGNSVARLSIDRHKIDVNTPVELVVGAQIRVALDITNASLRLILQKDSEYAIVNRASSNPSSGDGAVLEDPLLSARDLIAAIELPEPHDTRPPTIVAQAYAEESDLTQESLLEPGHVADHLQGAPTLPTPYSAVSAAAVAALYMSNGPRISHHNISEESADDHPDQQSENHNDDHKSQKLCRCHSGKESYALVDAHGNFCAYVCERCEAAVKTGYPAGIFTDHAMIDDEHIEAVDRR